jgi:hypothetical protein
MMRTYPRKNMVGVPEIFFSWTKHDVEALKGTSSPSGSPTTRFLS